MQAEKRNGETLHSAKYWKQKEPGERRSEKDEVCEQGEEGGNADSTCIEECLESMACSICVLPWKIADIHDDTCAN